MAASSIVGLYVQQTGVTAGQLFWYANGTASLCRFTILIAASGKMGNV